MFQEVPSSWKVLRTPASSVVSIDMFSIWQCEIGASQCLEYSPARRPSASEALQRLQHISSQVVDPYHNMTRLQLEKLLVEKDKLLIDKDEKLKQAEVNKVKILRQRIPQYLHLKS